jgi:hypothetical protein
MTDAAVIELASRIGVRQACDVVGMPQASYYRRHRLSPAPQRPNPIAHRDRLQPRALSVAEQQAILDVLHSDRFVDMAPAEVWATLLDEGVYLGSQSTFYRLLRRVGEVQERRAQATHPAKVKPELLAHAPNQVWSWDIERHEARLNRAVVKRRPPPARRSEPGEAEGSLIREMPRRTVSSPDNDEVGQHCQMVQARLARRRDVCEEPSAESPSRRDHQLEPGGSGLGSSAQPDGPRASAPRYLGMDLLVPLLWRNVGPDPHTPCVVSDHALDETH